MKKVRFGDVFELETSRGRVYYQYTHEHPFGSVVRVLPGFYQERPPDLARIIAGRDMLLLLSPVGIDLRNHRIALVENFPIPAHAAQMPTFRALLPGSIGARTPSWILDTGGAPRPIADQNEANNFPTLEISGANALRKLLEQNCAETLLTSEEPPNRSAPRPALYFLICANRPVAENVGRYLEARSFFDVDISEARDVQDRERALVLVASHLYSDDKSIDEAEQVIEEAVRLYGATYDGNEIPI
jgi:hypothetical protein